MTSRRLINAATAEMDRLVAQRARVDQRLAALDQERSDLQKDRRALLDQERLLRSVIDGGAADGGSMVLRGRRLRVEAVRVLWQAKRAEPIHYRAWFALVGAAGFTVLGTRPTATFLTAITRSPVVRGAIEPGVYYIDAGRLPSLRQELAEGEAELGDMLNVLARDPNPSLALREHRVTLHASARRLGRMVREAEESLGGAS